MAMLYQTTMLVSVKRQTVSVPVNVMYFRYNFKGFSKRELGYMMQVAKESWPTDKAPDKYKVEYYDQLLEELMIRWACEADCADHHHEGQRL